MAREGAPDALLCQAVILAGALIGAARMIHQNVLLIYGRIPTSYANYFLTQVNMAQKVTVILRASY